LSPVTSTLPLVSIIIPVYNVEDFIVPCLESVLAQDYVRLEIILVNDKTRDNSFTAAAALITSLREKYTLKILEHGRNRGLSAARNSGILAASGEYLFFLDSDDILPPGACSFLVSRLSDHGDCELVIGNYASFSDTIDDCSWIANRNGTTCSSPSFITKKCNEDIFSSFCHGEWNTMAWNKLIKKKLLTGNNIFFEKGIVHEDMLFSFQLALTASSMVIDNNITYYYRNREQSITSNVTERNIHDLIFVLNKTAVLFAKENLNQLFYIYLVNQCYYVFKLLVKHKIDDAGLYIHQLRKLLASVKSYRGKGFFLKKYMLFAPLVLSFPMVGIFSRIKSILSRA
jgi:glycosyltransferase involved in cell wall biosynthesis